MKFRLTLALVPLAFLVLAIAVPFAWFHPLFDYGAQRYFSFTCHQTAERCFWIAGTPMPICTRCTGIYLGAVFGLLLPARNRATVAITLWLAISVNALDVLLESAGLYSNLLVLRMCLGLALGGAMSWVIVSAGLRRGIENVFRTQNKEAA